MKVEVKHAFSVLLIFLFLFGFAQPFVLVTDGQKGSLVVDQAYWLRLANNAWNYFQPGVGLDPVTGLHTCGLGWPSFTDWDLGVYIQTIIDANKLGILSTSGTWGADARISKILAFLETRQLASNGLPYVWYQSTDGNPISNDVQNAADAGALLVALTNLRVFKPDLAGTINHIVYNRTNYAPLEQAVDVLGDSKRLYDYYVASGFAGFWPSRFSTLAGSILNNIVLAPTVSTYGVALPVSELMCEPLLLSVFNLAHNVKLDGLADLVYLAHEARYKATGKFVAFSEGNTGLSNPDYVYEWVVREDSSTWSIYDKQGVLVEIVPIIYFKAAIGLLAMYNTSFTVNMASYVESRLPNPTNGYSEGIDENGRVDTTALGNVNGMIIQAALYAINNPPDPSPTSSPSPSPSATIRSTSTPTPIPQVSLNMGISGSGSITPASGVHYYDVNSQVTISAVAGDGYTFDYWLFQDASKSYSLVETLTLPQSKSALAVFTLTPVPTPTISPGTTPSPTPAPTHAPTPLPTAPPTLSPSSTFVSSPNPSLDSSSSTNPPDITISIVMGCIVVALLVAIYVIRKVPEKPPQKH